VQTYNIKSSLIAEQTSIKIILISDLHSTVHKNNQGDLIDLIISENPDLIVMTGDIYCHDAPMKGVHLLLSGIQNTAPIFYVTGNHENSNRNFDEIMEELFSFGVIILSDTYREIEINGNKIIIAGIEDPNRIYRVPGYNQDEVMEETFRKLDDIHLYKILLTHRSESIEKYKNYSFDLILSGHAHGGQVRLFGINGLYAPHQGFFPKYAGGVYTHGDLNHIVSRGLSVSSVPRIFNPPELVVIVINGEE